MSIVVHVDPSQSYAICDHTVLSDTQHRQDSKRNDIDRYGIPSLPWSPGKNTGTSLVRKSILVC